ALANVGQRAIDVAVVFFEDASGINVNAGPEFRHRARSADFIPGIGIDRGGDELNQRTEVRLHAAAASRRAGGLPSTGKGAAGIGGSLRADLVERAAAGEVAVDV